jgi:hypothetical protein
MAGEVVQIISISVAEATMVIPYRNRGVQGFHRPELGAILIQQQAAETATMENPAIQAPIHGSQSARVSGVDGMANGPGQGGAESAIGVAVGAGIVVRIRRPFCSCSRTAQIVVVIFGW